MNQGFQSFSNIKLSYGTVKCLNLLFTTNYIDNIRILQYNKYKQKCCFGFLFLPEFFIQHFQLFFHHYSSFFEEKDTQDSSPVCPFLFSFILNQKFLSVFQHKLTWIFPAHYSCYLSDSSFHIKVLYHSFCSLSGSSFFDKKVIIRHNSYL